MNNFNSPDFYLGVVESRLDPLKNGRCRVRILGLHTWDKSQLPTEDLPWAAKIQPSVSGAMNGIGNAPVGLVEGTWVAVQFMDPEKQMPFIIGSLGGIPQSVNPPLEKFSILERDNVVPVPNQVISGAGVPVTSGTGEPVTTETPAPLVDPDWKKKVTIRLGELESSNNYLAVNQLNYLGKYQFGAAALQDRGYVKAGTSNRGLDEASNWTGKNGIRSKEDFLNNPEIQELVMSENIDANFRILTRIGVPIGTMSDAEKAGLIASAHLYGAGGAKQFYNGVVKADANGTTTERYYKEGFRSVAGSDPLTTKITRADTPRPEDVSLQNTQAIRDANPAEVDRDIREGNLVSFEESEVAFSSPNVGFKDPNGKYPLASHLNEPDTNRLARHEKIGETVVFLKEQNRHVGVEKANGKGSWDQAKTPYNAQYPFNNVYQSESGHLMEFDDTKGRERVHMYHTKGTFTEIDHNGTQVNFIVGDGYTIIERNGYVHVIGSLDVRVEGAHTLRVDGTCDVQINGKTTVNIHDSANLNVAGNMDMTVGGNFYVKAGGTIAMDAPLIHMNSGFAAGLQTIGAIGASVSSAAPLNVLTRKEETAIDYEVTEDDPSAVEEFEEEMIRQGALTKEQLETKPEVVEEVKPEPNQVEEQINECGIPASQNTFTGRERMGKYYNLADLTSNGSRPLKAQGGLTEAQIFCNLKSLAENVIDPIRDNFPNVKINSCFRYGTGRSQHERGQAVDLSFVGVSRAELYDVILQVQKLVPYDQLILEYLTPGGNGWIHVSFSGGNNRRQNFTMNNHRRISKDVFTISRLA